MPPDDDNQNLQKKHVTKQVSSNIFFFFFSSTGSSSGVYNTTNRNEPLQCYHLPRIAEVVATKKKYKEINSGKLSDYIQTHTETNSRKTL